MEREFDFYEVRDLLKSYKRTIREISDNDQLLSDTVSEISKITNSLLSKGIFERAARAELVNGQSAGSLGRQFDSLIRLLFKYRYFSPSIIECNEALEYAEDANQSAINTLSCGKSSLHWLFGSRQNKENANDAFIELEDAEEDLRKLLNQANDEIDRVQAVAPSNASDDYTEDPAAYWEALSNIDPDILDKGYRIKELSDIISKYSACVDNLNDIENRCAERKQAIEEAISQYLAQEALSILDDVPVDELSKARPGLRIKTLHDHGYHTLSDIYAASHYNLSSIKGITDATAYEIKQYTKEYAIRAGNSSKIRLNSDNKTKWAGSLIKSVYLYRQAHPYLEKAKSIKDTLFSELSPKVNLLKRANNGIIWYFVPEVTQARYREAYNTLSRAEFGVIGKEIDQLLRSAKEEPQVSSEQYWKDFEENPVSYYNILEEVAPDLLGNDDKVYGLPEDLAREIQEECFFPDGLLCELRRYQEWGVKYILHQERVLLGDEMGLGKTVQAIATMVSLKNTGATHFVVVCPASVVANWCREIRKMSKLSVTKVHGAGRNAALQSWLRTGGVAVTTYETTGNFKLDDNFRFTLLTVDEAHYIKNPAARRTVNVKNLCSHADRMLFMTGTALENKVEEMVMLVDILQPQIARRIKELSFMAAAPQFREAVAPVYYRRKREDVLTELPELIESKEWCTLNAHEEAAYEDAVLGKSYMEARRVSWNVDDLSQSSKANRMVELINEATEDGRKIIVFSFFLDTTHKIRRLLGARCMPPIEGSVTPQKRQEILDAFDAAPPGSVLVAQIQSGGTGLNIQSASVVILCEPQLKPSIENQAISRAYRMGQTRNVLVYRLLCENTVDEKIMEILENKQAIFDAFADESVAATESKAIDEKTFGNIIEEEIERINEKRKVS